MLMHDMCVYACIQLGRSDSSLSSYTAVCLCQATQSLVYVRIASIADRCTGDRPICLSMCVCMRGGARETAHTRH